MKLSTEIFNGLLEPLFKNKRMAVIVTFFLVFYGGAAGPKLPSFIIELFENPIFRVFILSLIVYKGNSNPMLSIMIAVFFTLMMDMINKQRLFEKFTRIERFGGQKLNFRDGNKEGFADLEIELEDSSPEDTEPIDSNVEKLPFEENELKNKLVGNGYLSIDQFNTLFVAMKDKYNSQGTMVLTSDEISGILSTDTFDASSELDLDGIVTELEGEQSIIETQDMMMIDDEFDDSNYGDINDQLIDEEMNEDISNLGF